MAATQVEKNSRIEYVREDTFFLNAENYRYDDGREQYALTYEQALDLVNALRSALDTVT